MAQVWVATDLARFGPHAPAAARPSLAESRAYCRRLAERHYENFTVASWLLARRLRPHFHAIYAYCRWADDLADETGDPRESLALLDWWQRQLADCYRGTVRHPVFVALAETIREFAIPPEPFERLLVAFRQDQRVTRYASHQAVLDYCQNSANPVGRLILYVARAHDEARGALSDSICTGLQLANFCQDVARDWAKGRIYLPADTLAAHGIGEADFAERRTTDGFRAALAVEVARAEASLRAGEALIDRVPGEVRLAIALFAAGGLQILRSIRRIDYDVWRLRPTISRAERLSLLARCWLRTWTAPGMEAA